MEGLLATNLGLMFALNLISSLTVVAKAQCPPGTYSHYEECKDCYFVCGPEYGMNDSECQDKCPGYRLSTKQSSTPPTTTSTLSSTLSNITSSAESSIASVPFVESENDRAILAGVFIGAFTLLFVVMIFLWIFKRSLRDAIKNCCKRSNGTIPVQEVYRELGEELREIKPERDPECGISEILKLVTPHPKPNKGVEYPSPNGAADRSEQDHLV